MYCINLACPNPFSLVFLRVAAKLTNYEVRDRVNFCSIVLGCKLSQKLMDSHRSESLEHKRRESTFFYDILYPKKSWIIWRF